MAERQTGKNVAILLAAIVVLAAGTYGVVVWRTFESASVKQVYAKRPADKQAACRELIIRESASSATARATATRPECDSGAIRVTVVEGNSSTVCVVDPTNRSDVACSRTEKRPERR